MRSLALLLEVLLTMGSLVLAEESPNEDLVTGVDEGHGENTVHDHLLVKTTLGPVTGKLETTGNGREFYAFYGLPFAQPPVGELRFKKPEPVSAWVEPLNATTKPPACSQMDLLTPGGSRQVTGQEDCLYLNVFTIKPDRRANLPVLVFIHGGGFYMGSADEYPPQVLMTQDIVLVVIQYRLAIFGFLSTEDAVMPGNFGLMDQTLALDWVQKNIEEFGGDTLRVTLMGESAGAASVHYQILTPTSIGLFSKAILHSGSSLCPWAMGGAHKEVAQFIGNQFNCTGESQDLLECLQKVDAQALTASHLSLLVWGIHPILLGPRVDGNFLPKEPAQLMNLKRHKKISIISGINRDEGAIFSLQLYGNEAQRSALRFNFQLNGPLSLEFSQGDIAPLNMTVNIFDHYVGGIKIDVSSVDNITRMYGDRHFGVCHDLTSSFHARNVVVRSKSVYRFELAHRGSRSISDLYDLTIGKHYVSHADDLFYFFEGGPIFSPITTEEDQQLRGVWLGLYYNFMTTGNPTPNNSLGFTWEPSTESDLRYLALQPWPIMHEDDRQQMLEFWTSLPTKENLIFYPEKLSNLHYELINEENKKSEADRSDSENKPDSSIEAKSDPEEKLVLLTDSDISLEDKIDLKDEPESSPQVQLEEEADESELSLAFAEEEENSEENKKEDSISPVEMKDEL